MNFRLSFCFSVCYTESIKIQCAKLVFSGFALKFPVIANQSADWCGNPLVRKEMYRKAPQKWEFPRFLEVIVPGSMGPGDCHDQCAHWSRNDSIIFQTTIHRTNIQTTLPKKDGFP